MAGGDLLVFTDPDCVADPVWLDSLVAASDHGHPVVGGAIELEGGGWPERGIHLSKFALWMPEAPPGSRPDLATANALWTRAAWERFGPFPGETWCGDTEISWRARRAGIELHFEPAAVVRHAHTTGLRAFFRERRIRGEDFARMRARVERWSRLRAGVHLLGAPLVPFLLLARSSRSAGGIQALQTAPVQLLGFLGWSLGEATVFAGLALRCSDPAD
jgi:GT2 family glycosyltransferase